MVFGKKRQNLFKPTLHNKQLEWVDNWTYLGVLLHSNIHFDCSVTERLKKFYKCLNAILRIDGRSDDLTMLQLLEAHCVPIITYAIEVLHVSDIASRRGLRAACNSIFRKIFGFRQYESVTALQGLLQKPTWEELVNGRIGNFNKKCFKNDGNSFSCHHFSDLIA